MKILFWAALLGLTPQAFAENHVERDHWHGDIRHFHEHDLGLWRGGHWFHGPHLGSPGWWWVVNGIWYHYETKVAAVPDPYMPPPVTVVVPPPVAVPPPPAPPPSPPPTWSYCNNPHGYYPYVTNCPGGWTSVPATPPPAP
jgi:hypothetical protein